MAYSKAVIDGVRNIRDCFVRDVERLSRPEARVIEHSADGPRDITAQALAEAREQLAKAEEHLKLAEEA